MVEPVQFPDIPRHRVNLSLDLGNLTWMQEHLGAGQLFGGPSHAAERSLARLQGEMSFVRQACQQAGIPFEADAFWEALYGEEIQQTFPSGGGRPRHGKASMRGLVYASIATKLIEWADKECITKGPCKSLSQVIDVGLLSFRRGDHRAHPSAFEEGLSMEPSKLFAAYRAALKTKAQPR